MRIKNIYKYKKWFQKEKADKHKLKLENKLYKLEIKKSNSKKYFGIEFDNLKQIVKRTLIAIVYLGVLLLISMLIDKIFDYFVWKDSILEYIKYDKEMFINFLISSLSIAGFLVALFYANLSGVFTSRYAHISSRISKELLNEYANRKYVNAIQNYIIVVLLVLLLNVVGINTDITLATMIIVLTIRIIMIFIELSKRIFIYSDISIIAQATMQKMIDIIRRVQVDNYKYDNLNFQNHHYKLIDENINTLSDLSDSLIRDKDHEGLGKLLNINLVLIANYSKVKNKIPYNSLWFPNTTQTKVWFKENDSELITAINTGTSLSPKLIRDKYFFENRLFEINFKIVCFFIKENQLKNVYNYFEAYHEYFGSFSKSGDVEYWYTNLQNNIKFIIDKIDFSIVERNDYVIGLLDLISLYSIDFISDFSIYIDNLLENISKIKWKKIDRTQVLKNNAYFMNNEQFNDFVKRLENERYVEKRLVTSNEFITEYVYCQLIEQLNTYINMLPKTIDELNKISEKLLDKQLLIEPALINSRIIELNNKILYRLGILEQQYEQIKQKENGNFKYKEINFELIKQELKKHYIISVEQFSKIIVGLYFEKYDIEKNKLDFIGQAFYQLTFLMLDLIYEDDYQSFEKLYSNFAAVCSISNSYIRNVIPADWNQPYVLNKYTMSTINFMNISGFAIYYSHLKKDDRWEKLVLNYAKDIIFSETNNNKGQFITNCKTCANIYNDNLLSITLLDTGLKSSMERFVESTKILKYKYVDQFGFHRIVDFDDELIRKFNYGEYGFSGNLFEVYLHCCINTYLKDEEKYKTKFNWAERNEKDEL